MKKEVTRKIRGEMDDKGLTEDQDFDNPGTQQTMDKYLNKKAVEDLQQLEEQDPKQDNYNQCYKTDINLVPDLDDDDEWRQAYI